jgi:hypothetical protein
VEGFGRFGDGDREECPEIGCMIFFRNVLVMGGIFRFGWTLDAVRFFSRADAFPRLFRLLLLQPEDTIYDM